MSSRERWTVYPLLFLTLGIALKDKITREITTNKVSCKAVWVTDHEGKPQLVMGHGPNRLLGMMFVDEAGKIVPGPSIIVQSRGPRPAQSGTAPDGHHIAPSADDGDR